MISDFITHKTTFIGLGILSAFGILIFPPIISGLILIGIIWGGLALFTPLSVLVVMLCLAPMRVLISTEATIQLPVDIGQIFLVAFLFTWLSYSIGNNRTLPNLNWTSSLLPIASFIGVAAITGFAALSLTQWLSEWLKWVQIFILVLIVLDLGYHANWKWIVFALVASGVANAVVGIYEYFGGSGALHLLINEKYFRAFGTFGQPNPFAGFMGLLAPIAIMASYAQLTILWFNWRKESKFSFNHFFSLMFYALSALLLIAGILVSYSRGAWLGFIGSLGILTLSFPKKMWQSAALFTLGITLLMGAWFTNLFPVSIVSRVETITDEMFTVSDVRGVDITPANYAIVERLAHWQVAIRMAESKPILGVGIGNYEVAYKQYQLINWDEPLGHAHNYYLNVLAETGLSGFFAYSIMWIAIIVLTWQTRKHPDLFARSIAVGLLGTWTYLAVHSLTDNLYVNNLFLHIGIMLGLLMVLHKQVSDWGVIR